MFVRGRAVAWAFVAVDLSPVFACDTGIAEAWLAGAGLVVAIEGGLLNRNTLALNAKAPRHTHRTMSSQTLRNVFDMPCVWRVSQDVGGVKSAHQWQRCPLAGLGGGSASNGKLTVAGRETMALKSSEKLPILQ